MQSPCSPCVRSLLVDRPIGPAKRCPVCASEAYSFHMDHGHTVHGVFPGDAVLAAEAGDVAALVPHLASGNIGIPIREGRNWGQLCLSYFDDPAAWGDAFVEFDGPRDDWLFQRLLKGVQILAIEAAARIDLPAMAFRAECAAPEGSNPYGATVEKDGDSFLIGPEGRLFRWMPGTAPRELWTGLGRLEPLGGGLWRLGSPGPGSIHKLVGDELVPADPPPTPTPPPAVEHRVERAVIPGGWCSYGVAIQSSMPGNSWHMDAKPEWIGSERLFLAVGEEVVYVVDAFTGERSTPLVRPAESERVYGAELHGGVYVCGGVHATFVDADGAAEPWRPMPFPAYAVHMSFGDRVVFRAESNEPQALVARRDEDGWRFEGVVDGAWLARGQPGPAYHLISPADGPLFLSEERWMLV
jgi:hypothetical protein